jgi:hypothetical protein
VGEDEEVSKIYEGQQQLCISCMPEGGHMEVGTFVDHLDVMNHANFHVYQIKVLSKGDHNKKIGYTFEMHKALTTLPGATTLASDSHGSISVIAQTN